MTTTASPDPGTMMALAAIAYDDMHSIPQAVEGLGIGLTVAWGPAELRHLLDPVPYSAAFIATNGSGQYTVVIRGTEWDSLSSWEGEDFDIAPAQPFSQFAANAVAKDGQTPMITQGSCNGLNDVRNLVDPKTGQGIAEFLVSMQPAQLYVTGHSLGGTLTPPVFAWLNHELYGGVYADNMAPCSFAGLTAGNAAFNRYFSGLFNPRLSWRFYNTLDIAPLCWGQEAALEAIYTPQGLHYGEPESHILGPCFAAGQQMGCEQPDGGYALEGSPATGIVQQTWPTQAMAQHHHSTYVQLVGAHFKVPAAAAAVLQPEPEPQV